MRKERDKKKISVEKNRRARKRYKSNKRKIKEKLWKDVIKVMKQNQINSIK